MPNLKPSKASPQVVKSLQSVRRLQFSSRSPLHKLNPLPSPLSKRFCPLRVITSPRTTSLSPSEPGRNALHNHGSSERKKCIAPRHVRARFVPRRLGVPANALLAPWQPWNNPRRELRQLAVPTVDYVGACEVAEV